MLQCFIMDPLSLFSRVIISILRIPSKTGLVLLRKDWKKWKKVTCQLQSYTWRLLSYKNPMMQRYSLVCLLLIKEKGTPFSMQWWNSFGAQTLASHDWQTDWMLTVVSDLRMPWNKGELLIRWESIFEIIEFPSCHLKALKRDNISNFFFSWCFRAIF